MVGGIPARPEAFPPGVARGKGSNEVIERGDRSIFVGEVIEGNLHGEAEVLTLKEIGANYGR